MRRAARIDANHAEVVEALRSAGCKVWSTADVGHGFPDLLVGYRGVLHLLEVKNGSKPPSKRKLTEDEAKFHNEWSPFPVHVVNNPIEALTAVGCMVT